MGERKKLIFIFFPPSVLSSCCLLIFKGRCEISDREDGIVEGEQPDTVQISNYSSVCSSRLYPQAALIKKENARCASIRTTARE